MNRLRVTTLIILLFAFSCSFAVAADRPKWYEKPEDVVARLYRDFSWEALISPSFFAKDALANQPVKVLKQYFTSRLAELIAKDTEFEIRTKELGHIDFMLIFGSQDPEGISNIRINRNAGTNVVSVLYDGNGEKDIMKMHFETVQTGSGWRISDIRYKTRKSHAFPGQRLDFSLLELLSEPYE